MATFVSYNVNGIRAALKKGWLDWLRSVNPDVLCIQETKAQRDQLDVGLFEELGYQTYWFSAKKKGYSGVALFSKVPPQQVTYGCGIAKYDDEGRIVRADFGDFSVMSCYFPSGSSGDERQSFKMNFLADFQDYIRTLKESRAHLLLAGDVNICHQPIDIHNPERNKDTSGFKPEERAWVSQFLAQGFVDSFRHLNKEPHHYTWWSYRSGARRKNLGWRIDYQLISENLVPQLKRAVILSEAVHSDHCPILVELEVDLLGKS